MPATYLDSTELVLNMGPQHPSTHGVLRVIVKLDGEKVSDTNLELTAPGEYIVQIGKRRFARIVVV